MNPVVLTCVLLLAAAATAQYRPFYAGNGVQYPRPFNSGGSDSGDGLGDRGGFGGDAVTSRVDAYGHDTKLLQDAANTPVNNQPFWYRNRELIMKHIGLNPTPAGAAAAAPAAAPAAGAPVVDVVEPLESQRGADPASNVA